MTKRVLCLVYHRVGIIKNDYFNLAVTPIEFERHMSFLKKNYKIVRFDEEWILKNIGDKAVAITFDDGYVDNYVNTLPILGKYQIPATMFISTGNIGKESSNWDNELFNILMQDRNYPNEFELKDDLYNYKWDTSSKESRWKLASILHMLLRMEPPEKINDWLEQLQRWSGINISDRQENKLMSIEQLKLLASSDLITIGAHTVNHSSLRALSKEAQKKEIENSIGFLEHQLQQTVEVFAYPFGSVWDYNEDTLEILKNCGIHKACTTKEACWSPDCNPYLIPRVSIGADNSSEFEAIVRSFLEE